MNNLFISKLSNVRRRILIQRTVRSNECEASEQNIAYGFTQMIQHQLIKASVRRAKI